MSLIPKTYAIPENSEAPDGTVVKECKYCHGKFAIPSGEVDKYKTDVCEDCSEQFDKDVAAATASLMKNPTDAADTIKKALGN